MHSALSPALLAFKKALPAAHGRVGRVSLALDAASGIARLVLRNRPHANALSSSMMVDLSEAIDRLEQWDAGAAVVLSGEGGTFCAGAALNDGVLSSAEMGALFSGLMSESLTRLRRLPLVSVAAIDGAAIGGGAELATATDWRLLAPGARVQFVQARMGVSTGWGGAGRLAETVGRREALRLLLHSPSLDAAAAVGAGLADAVGGEGEPAAEAAVRLLLEPALERAGSRQAVRALKAAVAAHSQIDEAATRAETSEFAAVWGSPANKAAVARAVSRRREKQQQQAAASETNNREGV